MLALGTLDQALGLPLARAAPGRSLLPELKSCSCYFQPDNSTSLQAGLRFMLRQVLVQSIGQREQFCFSCFPLLTANPQEKGIYGGPISGSALHCTSASKIDAVNVLCPSLRGFSKPLPRDHMLQIPLSAAQTELRFLGFRQVISEQNMGGGKGLYDP